jgi:hypothetical protein
MMILWFTARLCDRGSICGNIRYRRNAETEVLTTEGIVGTRNPNFKVTADGVDSAQINYHIAVDPVSFLTGINESPTTDKLTNPESSGRNRIPSQFQFFEMSVGKTEIPRYFSSPVDPLAAFTANNEFTST